MSNGKVMIIHLINRLMKKILLYKLSYFPAPYTRSKSKIKVELDLPNHTKKSDLKNATDVDVSEFAKKTDLASLKPKIDKLDIDELEIFPVDISKLSNVVKNEVVKKTLYDELVKKVVRFRLLIV